MGSMVRNLNLPPSRIPQKTSLSVSRLADKLSKLDSSGGAMKPSPRPQVLTSPKRILSPVIKNTKPIQNDEKTVSVVKNTKPIQNDEKKVNNVPNKLNATTTISKPVNGSLKNNASIVNKNASSVVKTNALAKEEPKTTVKSATPPGMKRCTICGRNFADDRIQKHQQICAKGTKKKRKVFDPLKQRLKGTEAEKMYRTLKESMKEPQPRKTPNNWKKQHEEFIANIRAARQVKEHLAKGGKLSDLPPPPPLDTSSYTPCPHCGRKFNEAAAERHIAACANMRHNKSKPTTLTKTDTNKVARTKIVNRKR